MDTESTERLCIRMIAGPPLISMATTRSPTRWARRSRGFAVDIGSLIRRVTSVAAAVRDRSGRARLVVGVHALQGQLEASEITKLGGELHALATRSAAALYQASTPSNEQAR